MTTLRTATASLALALLALIASAPATTAGNLDHEVGIRFLVADPAGDFDANVDDLGFGLAADWGVRPCPRLKLGLGGHFAIYGSESTRMDLPLVDEFDLTTTNNLAGGWVFAQLRPFDGPLQPYAEGRVGLQYLWTQSELEDSDWWDGDDVARETNYDDWAGFWSAGGGLMVRLSGGSVDSRKPGVMLDFKVTYQRGERAEYLAEGAVEVVDDEPVFEVSESETDLLTYEVGVALTF
jgi:hypothetical protein